MKHFEPYLERTLTPGTRVRVHWHYNRLQWSIKAIDGPHAGFVVGYADALNLEDVSFQVGAWGREEVRKSGHKNVHAYCVGTLAERVPLLPLDCGRVRYNPYDSEYFHWADTRERIERLPYAVLVGEARVYAPKEQ